MKKIDGRVKSIVTVSHFATDIVRPRAQLAKSCRYYYDDASLSRIFIKGNADQIYEQFNEISKVGIPIMMCTSVIE